MMCFAEPGRVESTDGLMARVVTGSGPIDVSLSVLRSRGDQVQVGDWVVAALGLALERITEDEGRVLMQEHRALRDEVGADVR